MINSKETMGVLHLFKKRCPKTSEKRRKDLRQFTIFLIVYFFIGCSFKETISIHQENQKMIVKIDESKFIKLGDVNQFLIIRSDNIENPILLLLHGGTTETAHFIKFNHDLEKYFTVVYWEQRGEGKSYQKNSNSKLLTLERYVEDIHELTNYLKDKFQKEKIYLLGHSMGTLLGMKTIDKYPNDYIAYIAISQVANPIQSDSIAYDSLLKMAKEKGNTKDVNKILSIDRVTKENLLNLDFTKRTNELIKLSIKYGGLYYQASFFKILKTSLFPILTLKEYNFKDKMRAIKQHEERILFYYQNNLIDNITKIEVPIYFIHGKDDYIINYNLTKEYFQKLKAPKKKFFTFDKSAHFPPFEEPDKFNDIVVNQILFAK